MILEETDIQQIIINNPNKHILAKARMYASEMRTNLYGENLQLSIKTIEGLEMEYLQKIRAKYAKSNKDLYERIGRPLDKIFTAKGGSLYFNLSDKEESEASKQINDLKNGLSVQEWIKNKWSRHIKDDPSGIIFIEIDAEGNPYPTYKSTESIYEWGQAGRRFEYIIFNVSDKEKVSAGIAVEKQIYRVVDDAFDMYVERNGESVTSIENQTFPNFFGVVPAMIMSDFEHPTLPGMRVSVFEPAREITDEFFIDYSIKRTHKFRHGFPKPWEVADKCISCMGEGKTNAKNCENCGGTGFAPINNMATVKLVSHPVDNNDPFIAPNYGGYIDIPKDYYEIAENELHRLESAAYYTIWGTYTNATNGGAANTHDGEAITATQANLDYQPVCDKLNIIQSMREARQSFIINMIITVKFNPSYKGCTYMAGRRFLIEGPDVVWNRYVKAKKEGAPGKVLNDLLIEYIETKYESNRVALNAQLKLIKVEPFVHYTIDEVKNFNVSDSLVKAKLFFSEWLDSKSDAYILAKNADELKSDLYAFSEQKEFNKAFEMKQQIGFNQLT